MPSHFSHREKGILSQSSPVATQIPHSVGAALALKWIKPNIATATVGEEVQIKEIFMRFKLCRRS